MNMNFSLLASWILRYLLTIKITDVLDIGIMVFIFYQVLTLVQSTKAASLLKGLFIFLAAMVLSSLFHLNGIYYIMSRMVNLGVLALIVLFQPEIRRLLEQVGSGALGEMLFRKENVSNDDLEIAITQTVAAYTAFSKDKVGALIVFERKTPLDEFIKTGTALNCSVNSELLKNLFWNKAPMHDGAVIVRNGRIIGAGCVLPLSGNANLSRDLGMRHRAGIGMSENSDAVVAIVSEETGSISVAVDGMLKRHLAPETLDRLLRTELMPEPTEPVVSKLNFLDRLNLDRFKKKEAEEHE